MSLKVFAYKNCDTCRKAKKFLESNKVAHQFMPIREQPPPKSDLKAMLACYDGSIRKLFNTSGRDYKTMNMKDKIPEMSDSDAIDLLSQNGNLIKRPFAIMGEKGTVGFKEEVWSDLFL